MSAAPLCAGLASFKNDLFAGRIPFAAQATGDGWMTYLSCASIYFEAQRLPECGFHFQAVVLC